MADNWHILLDDSVAGASSGRFGYAEMDAHFERRLASLPPGSGPDRIGAFTQRINEYFERVLGLDPDLAFVSGLTDVATVPMTTGLFAWIGGLEWHIHAWDFAQVIGEDAAPRGSASGRALFLDLAAPLFLLTAAWPVLQRALDLDPDQRRAILEAACRRTLEAHGFPELG